MWVLIGKLVIALLIGAIAGFFESKSEDGVQTKKTKKVKQKKGIRPYVKSIVLAIVAVLSIEATDWISAKYSDPEVKITVQKNAGEFKFNFQKKNRAFKSLDLSFPITGKVTSVRSLTPNTQAKRISKLVLGDNLISSVNPVRVTFEDISASAKLDLSIFYDPWPKAPGVERSVLGANNFNYRYMWDHGDLTKLVDIETNKEIPDPGFELGSFTFFPDALTDEQMKEMWKKGPPIQDFETVTKF